MITEQDLKQAIAECQGEKHPNANTCIKLSAYLTIYEHLYHKSTNIQEDIKPPQIEANTREIKDNLIGEYGESEFYQTIKGKHAADVWAVMDELMETIKLMNPRLYDGVLHQLS